MKKSHAVLDGFRLVAAALVVAIHTSPLVCFGADADFLLTRVLGRLAVPFFLMVTGCFLLERGGVRRFLTKTLGLYAAVILLYLPLNFYAGGFPASQWPSKLLLEGTFYHLWYLPAVLLGVPLAFFLHRLKRGWALTIAGMLYLIGLCGDSYYGVVCQVPAVKGWVDGLLTVFPHTRNGLFMAPLFLLLGAETPALGKRLSKAFSPRGRRLFCAVGFAAALAGMAGEALALRSIHSPRHDSMTLMLPVCSMLLFALLMDLDGGRNRRLRSLSTAVYVLHPWAIVLVRGLAKVARVEEIFIDNSLWHYLAVLALTFALSAAWLALWTRCGRGRPHPPKAEAPLPSNRKNARDGHGVSAHRRERMPARAWREVDLAALRGNAAAIQAWMGASCKLMAVVKADAYGHGAVAAAKALWKEGVRDFAVATLSEGVELRRAGVGGTILILGYTRPEDARRLWFWRLTQTVADEAHGQALSGRGVRLRVHLALDTGMHRLGIPVGDMAALLRVARLPNLRVEGVFSHLCVSDSAERSDAAFTEEQSRRFYAAVDGLRAAGVDPGKIHLQASGGMLNRPDRNCDYVRAGIALYGASASEKVDLWPVLSLRARVASVRTLAAGETAGYGRAFTARRETRLAAVAIGYADGVPRNLADGGEVLIRGRRAPIAGRICMDQLLADVTEIEGVCPGDVATLIGRDGASVIEVGEVAERCGTIPNEILSRLGGRLETRFVGN